MTTENIPFGLLVRRARDDQGFTQKKLAAHLSVDSSVISGLETSPRRKPTPQTHQDIAKALGVDPEEIKPPEFGKWSLSGSKKSSNKTNVKHLTLAFASAAVIIGLIAVVVNITPKAQAVLSENPEIKAQFNIAVSQFPEDGHKGLVAAYECFQSKLIGAERENFWQYAKNYTDFLLRERAGSFKGRASLELPAFVCGGRYRDFKNG